jgi:hypothetical protein
MLQQLLEHFKNYIDVGESDDSKDEVFLELLAYVEDYIYSVYGVAIIERTVVDILVPYYSPYTIYTKDGYISSVNSLTIDDTDVDVTTLRFKRNRIVLSVDSNITFNTTSSISVNYTVGYADITEVPGSLLNALFILAKKIYNDATKDTDTLSSISINIKEGVRVFESIPVMAATSLEPHRMYRI